LKNERGTVAMARKGDPNSATAQFFVNVVDNAFLDATAEGKGYAVFGRVVSGMEVVDKIRDVPTANRGPHQNVPVQPVVITSVTLQP
jgi:peptidyl-prolyl cis-trans isomerase A (cyclophilin A)